MIKNKFVLLLVVFSFLIALPVLASVTNGTIDPNAHYAWGENVGWVDFSNVGITDTALSGSAYGENIGWIDLSTITNNEGTLSGYAWGENIGWVDFSNVTIGTDGIFAGGAYSENTGWIIFGTTTNKVMTDWRPASTRVVHHYSSGSYMPGYGPKVLLTTPSIVPSITPPATTPNTSIPDRILRLGITGQDVKNLQIYLNTHGYIIAKTDAGSIGNETTKFGKLTQKAVMKFQKANNLTPDGVVGPLTRVKLK